MSADGGSLASVLQPDLARERPLLGPRGADLPLQPRLLLLLQRPRPRRRADDHRPSGSGSSRTSRDMQVLNLTLSGGEPLAHPDFFVLGRKARDLGFVVRVKSNGHALGAALARRLKDEVDPYMVEVSLHGACAGDPRPPDARSGKLRPPAPERRRDARRGSAREDERDPHGLERGRDRRDVRRRRRARDPAAGRPRGHAARRRRPEPPRRHGVAGRGPAAAAPGVRARRGGGQAGRRTRRAGHGRDHAPAVEPASDRGKHCGAGSSGIAVDPYGNVYPCVQWRRAVGNLHGASIREIWTGSRALDTVRGLTVEAKGVVAGHGDDGPLLNFCPGPGRPPTGTRSGSTRARSSERSWSARFRKSGRRFALRVLPG